ncbi:DUF305 domain-containing protein [Porphyrobacter sp. GA68]|uniref:CopM family metallochaperone n=1 Tax=Porphyrobacter sp. GA68 TaxID=2883480 RepID=UPI001D180D8B|nr:DUF305 domain-containing protein [Porphyrobacter sp. GA68]
MRNTEDRRAAAGPPLMRWTSPIMAAVLLAGCQAEGSAPAPQDEGAVATAAPMNPAQQAFADVNTRMHAAMANIPTDADEAFIRGMLAHHRGAVEMAEVELAHGANPQARDLAQRIIDAQGAEIAEMEAWLTQRGLPTAAPTGAAAQVDHSGH